MTLLEAAPTELPENQRHDSGPVPSGAAGPVVSSAVADRRQDSGPVPSGAAGPGDGPGDGPVDGPVGAAPSFQRVVLVGVDDPFLAQQLVAGDLQGGPSPRSKLSIAIASVVVLLCFVAGLAWLRFDDLSAMPGTGGPVPEVTITPTAGTLSEGGPVEVTVGAGAAVERVDVFVDGDWTGVDTTAPYAPEWEHRSPGVHEVKAKVTTADGAVRYSDPVEVTVKG